MANEFIIGWGLTITIGVFGAYVKIMTRLKEFDIRLKNVEDRDVAILKKLDHISDSITEVKVKLENKQNRQ